MSELKRLPSTDLTNKRLFGLGFYAGPGFWVAGVIFFLVIIPALACAGFVTFTMVGGYIGGALGG